MLYDPLDTKNFVIFVETLTTWNNEDIVKNIKKRQLTDFPQFTFGRQC